MLLNDFYTIADLRVASGAFRADLLLNAAHPIFGGHFPDRPVLPGACQLQMVREMLSQVTGREYHLVKADTIKFITLIDPRNSIQLELALNYEPGEAGQLRVTATLSAATKPALKFIGVFRAG